MILRWLNLEKARPPFVVLEQETTRFVTIGDLNLTLQIDRIDQLSHDQWMIIDYKTGTLTDDLLQSYNQQLQIYGQIIALNEQRPIRLGLYFPLTTIWKEWAFGSCDA